MARAILSELRIAPFCGGSMIPEVPSLYLPHTEAWRSHSLGEFRNPWNLGFQPKSTLLMEN